MILRRKRTSAHLRSNARHVKKRTRGIRDPIRIAKRETPSQNKKVLAAKIRLDDDDMIEGSTEEAAQQLAPNVVWKLGEEDMDTVRTGSVTNRSLRNSTGRHDPTTNGSHTSTPSINCHVRCHEDDPGDAVPPNTDSCDSIGDTNAYLGPSSSPLQHHLSSELDEDPTMAPPTSSRASRDAKASPRASQPSADIRLYTDIYQYVCESDVTRQIDNSADEFTNDDAEPELVQSNALELSIPSVPHPVNTQCATAPVANRDPGVSGDHLDQGSCMYSYLVRDQEEGNSSRFDRDMLSHEGVSAREARLRANEEKCTKLQTELETQRLEIKEARNALAAKERGIVEREKAATARETNCLQREQHLNGLQAELSRNPSPLAVHIGRLEEMLAAQRYGYRVLVDRYTALSYANDQFRAAAERAQACHTQQLEHSHDHIKKCQAYIQQCKARIAWLERVVHFWGARRRQTGVCEPNLPNPAFALGRPSVSVDIRDDLMGRRVNRMEMGKQMAPGGNGRSAVRVVGGTESATIIDRVSGDEAGRVDRARSASLDAKPIVSDLNG